MQVKQCFLIKDGEFIRIRFPFSPTAIDAYAKTVYDAAKIILAWYANCNFVDFIDEQANKLHRICMQHTEILTDLLFFILFRKDEDTTN